jgi:hypothetical protein
MHKEFRAEKRNIRFALSTDGMNPFGERSNMHNTCPMLRTIYNLPLAMSQEKFHFAYHSNPRTKATWYRHRCFPGAIDVRNGKVLETWG